MTKYLISFPSEAMKLSQEDFVQAGIDAHRVVAVAKAAGVWVFGGGIAEDVDPVMVAADGTVTPGTYPGSYLKGGFTVLEVPTRAEAEAWAARIAAACRCEQEVREFMFDPES